MFNGIVIHVEMVQYHGAWERFQVSVDSDSGNIEADHWDNCSVLIVGVTVASDNSPPPSLPPLIITITTTNTCKYNREL